MGDHGFGPAGGEVALDTEGNVLLYVPENTFKRPTTVTWSLTEGVPGCPVVDIVARELGRDFEPEVKLFEKYVQIIYKNVPVTSGQTGSVTVEGGPDFPTLRVPRQNFEQPEIADSKPEVDDSTPETPKSKPEIDESKTEVPETKPEIALSRAKSSKVDLTEDVVDEGLGSKKTNYDGGEGVLFTDGNLLSSQSEQRGHTKAERELEGKPETEPVAEVEPTAEVESIFHTFYTFRDATTLVIYTKHFSRFSPDFRCPDHQGECDSAFDSNIKAAIFRSREPVKVKDEYHMSVKVVLQIEDGGVPIGEPNRYENPWRIDDHNDYTYIKKVTLLTPPNSTLIQPGSKFDVRVEFSEGETEEWTFNKEFLQVQENLENCIPCRECFHETLPDAAVMEFTWKPPDDMGACVDMRTKADVYGARVDMRTVTARPRDFSFNLKLDINCGTYFRKKYTTSPRVDITFKSPMVDVQEEDLNRVQSNLSSNNNANSPTGVSTAVTTEGSSSFSFMPRTDGDIDLLSRRMGSASINQGQPSGLPRSGNLPPGVNTGTPVRARTTTDGSIGQAAGSGIENLTLDVGTSTPARRRTTTDGATSDPPLGQMSPLSPDQPSVTSGDDGYRLDPADSNMDYDGDSDEEGSLPSNEAVILCPSPDIRDCNAEEVQPRHKDQQGVYELTPEHLSELSKRLTTKSKIETLGAILGVEDHHIDAAFSDNNGDIKSAAKEVLKTWRSRFASATDAYAALWWALDRAELIQDAAIVLKHRPPCQVTSDNPPP